MIGIIPARANSKRIKRKNIRYFCGKPIINYSIERAIDSKLFEHIIVSTDNTEIASISISAGAEVPFIRPKHLAEDNTPTVPVVSHAINECDKLGWNSDYFCCIYPCAPFIQNSDLHNALNSLKESNSKYSFGITEYESPIQRALKIDDSGKLLPFFPEYQLTRTQDLEKSYYDAGQFIWGTREAWLGNLKVHSNGIGIVIPRWRSVDIDV